MRKSLEKTVYGKHLTPEYWMSSEARLLLVVSGPSSAYECFGCFGGLLSDVTA
jgi:hypothetical protein